MRLCSLAVNLPPARVLGTALVAFLALPGIRLHAGTAPKKADAKGDTVAAAKGIITPQAWRSASTAPLQPGEVDRLIDGELAKAGVRPGPGLTDEQFVRRVLLDLTGRLPVPADVTEFLADRDPNKRARLIDRLLDSPEFARHWAGYWREVLTARLTDARGRLFARHFEEWLAGQIRRNAGWADVVRAMLTAGGEVRFAKLSENGGAFFLLSHVGADSANERAAETARVFLGIQLQCAQCHDHPFDDWKQVQFHQLAAYFARLKERPLRENKKVVGFTLVTLPRGEHRLPDRDNPKKGGVVHPRFLDGKSPGVRLGDAARRRALANAVTGPDNPWFAAAYVNRIWGALMGQAFYQPVDDMGLQRDAVFPRVLPRLAAAFRGSGYDTKAFFRAVLNSRAYQRQARLGDAADQHLLFAAVYPTRLPADALWQSLVNVLGKFAGPAPKGKAGFGPFRQFGGLEGLVKQTFGFDPSARAEEVEGSIPQALLLMNNPQINQRILARGTNLLARILSAYPQDEDALRMVYLRALARRPTEREMGHCLQYISRTRNRAEAYEDILWSLLNSTEFQTRR
jgi:hypothetical protein